MKKKILLLILCISLLAICLCAIPAFAAGSDAASGTGYTEEDIPAGSSPASTHPFAVFKIQNGDLKGTETVQTLYKAVESARNWNNTWAKIDNVFQDDSTRAGRSSVILLRSNYTTTTSDKYNNYGQGMGVITIDLNNKILTQGKGTQALFTEVTSKGSQYQGYIFDTKYIVKNGYIALNDAPVLRANVYNSVAGSTYNISDKHFYWDFENVNFKYVSGATSENMLTKYDITSQNSGKPNFDENTGYAPFYFNYTDCTFDLTNAPASVTLFDANPASELHIKSTITVSGGKIVLPDSKSLTLTNPEKSVVTGSSVKFEKSASGKHLEIEASANADISTEAIKTSEGTRYFIPYEIAGQKTNYILTECTGTLPENYRSPDAYPFVVFKYKNGKMEGATACVNMFTAVTSTARDWNNIYSTNKPQGELEANKKNNPYSSVVLLRKNYTTVAKDYNSNGNWAQCMGTITIDLNKFILTQGEGTADALFTRIVSKPSSSQGYFFASKYVVKNGSIALRNQLIHLSVWKNSNADPSGTTTFADKEFTWDFEDVKITCGASTSNMLAKYDTGDPTAGDTAPFFFNFKDCEFDLTNAPASVTLFNANPKSTDRIKAEVKVYGGNIILPAGKTLTVTQTKSSDGTSNNGSSVTFEKSENSGKYTSLDAPDGNVPTEEVKAGNERGYFLQNIASGDSKYYVTECKLDLGNGFIIPEANANPYEYPFVVFNDKGDLVGACKYWLGNNGSGGALGVGRSYLDGDGKKIFVFMRRDYTLRMIENTTNYEHYNNLAQSNGTINVELGGYTLSGGNIANSLIPAISKEFGGKVFPTNVIINNGTMRHWNGGIVNLQTWDIARDGLVAGKEFNITFNKVTLGFVAGTDSQGLTTHVKNSISGSDQKGGPSTEAAPYNITYKDCVFDTSTRDWAVIFKLNVPENIHAIVTHKVNGGVIKNGSSANTRITDTVVTDYASIIFGKGSDGKYLTFTSTGAAAPGNVYTTEDGVDCVYTKSAEKDGKVTYSLYPKAMLDYKVKTSVTLWSNFVYNVYLPAAGTESFTIGGKEYAYSEVELDGVKYYRVRLNLAAYEALTDNVLKVKIKSGDTTVNGSWTLNLLNYTKTVINGNYIVAEKNLMKDMLAYTKEAYSYFEKTSDKLSAIDTLIGKDYSSKPDMNKAAKNPSGSKFSEVTFYLGDSPAYRFYYKDSVAPSYTFNVVGGRAVNSITGTDSHGKYVQVKVYAYEILSGISFTDGNTTYEYNIYQYYSQADASVKPLVEKLVKYCESAERYRVKDEYGTMTLNAPKEIYANYKNDISVSFTGKDPGEVTYTAKSSNSNVTAVIENGVLIAKADGITRNSALGAVTLTVTATTEYHSVTATITVTIYEGEYSGGGGNINAEGKLQYYEKNIIKPENKGGIIFIGDSYFDGASTLPSFYKDFYLDWADEKAFLMGMSSSEIHQLEVVSERLVYPMEPKEIVVHIGHNDMHSGPLTPEQFVARLQALLSEYHEKLPNTKIYYLGVESKKSPTNDTIQKDNRYYSSFIEAPAVNAAMQTFASKNSGWLKYVDTPSIFYAKAPTYANVTVTGQDANGVDIIHVDTDGAVNANMYPSSDGSHPTLSAYDLIRFKINEARGKANSDVITFNNLNAADMNVGAQYFDAKVNGTVSDFAVSGKLVITQVSKNPHVQFRLSNNQRFLVWDKDDDGVFTAEGDALYDAKAGGLVLNWAVISQGGTAYWFVDGQLKKTYEGVTSESLKVGALASNVVLYDIDFDVKAKDEAAYNAHIAPYFSENDIYVEAYGNQAVAILNTGKKYTVTDNYIIRGKLNISEMETTQKPHLQFRFGSGSRFLLWDNNKDGKLGVAYTAGSLNYCDTSENYKGKMYNFYADDEFILDWAVVVNAGKAYFYIEGELVCTLDTPNLTECRIGAFQMNVLFYDIELIEMSKNEATYNTELAKYLTTTEA